MYEWVLSFHLNSFTADSPPAKLVSSNRAQNSHSERSRPIFSSAFALAKASVCAVEESLFDLAKLRHTFPAHFAQPFAPPNCKNYTVSVLGNPTHPICYNLADWAATPQHCNWPIASFSACPWLWNRFIRL